MELSPCTHGQFTMKSYGAMVEFPTEDAARTFHTWLSTFHSGAVDIFYQPREMTWMVTQYIETPLTLHEKR